MANGERVGVADGCAERDADADAEADADATADAEAVPVAVAVFVGTMQDGGPFDQYQLKSAAFLTSMESAPTNPGKQEKAYCVAPAAGAAGETTA